MPILASARSQLCGAAWLTLSGISLNLCLQICWKGLLGCKHACCMRGPCLLPAATALDHTAKLHHEVVKTVMLCMQLLLPAVAPPTRMYCCLPRPRERSGRQTHQESLHTVFQLLIKCDQPLLRRALLGCRRTRIPPSRSRCCVMSCTPTCAQTRSSAPAAEHCKWLLAML
jgi:hypothetical protein